MNRLTPMRRLLSAAALLSLSCAAFVAACTDEVVVGWDEDAGGAIDASEEREVGADAPKDVAGEEADAAPSCESAGGVCSLPDAGCEGGTWADAGALVCSAPEARCCVPSNDDGGIVTCESEGGTCLSVGPTSCADGHWTSPAENSCHDWVGFLCCVPGPGPATDAGGDTACEVIGGGCVSLGPNLCENAIWQAPVPFLCGSALDLGCCFPL